MKFTHALAANCNFTLFSISMQVIQHTSTVYCPVLNSSEIERIIDANITNLSLYLYKIIVFLWQCYLEYFILAT